MNDVINKFEFGHRSYRSVQGFVLHILALEFSLSSTAERQALEDIASKYTANQGPEPPQYNSFHSLD